MKLSPVTSNLLSRPPKSTFLSVALSALALSGACNSAACAAESYSITNVGLPAVAYDRTGQPLRYDNPFPTAINDRGQVTGSVDVHSWYLGDMGIFGVRHPWLWENGVITDLEPLTDLGEHASYGYALGINNAGTAVGTMTLEDGRQVAVVWQNGERILLEPQETVQLSMGIAINEVGHVVGSSANGFVIWHDGLKTDLGIDGFSPTGINDSDHLCGYLFDGSGSVGSGILRDGVFTPILHIGSDGEYVAVEAYAINAAGQVAGLTSHSENTYHAFVWHDGTTIDLGVLGVSPTGYSESAARALNDRGQVVGYSTTAVDGSNHGFLWEDGNGNGVSDPGEMCDLNTLLPPNSGWEILAANGINNQGQIVGLGLFTNGETVRRDVFVMTPLSATQRMQNLSASVTALVQSGVSLPADGQSLLAKLNAARQNVASGNLTATINELSAFINQVVAFVGNRKLTAAQGQALIDAAQAIIAILR